MDSPAVKSRPGRTARRRALALGAAVVIAVMVAVGTVWKTHKPAGDQAAPSYDRALAMPTGPAIAVLPFTNMSGDPKQDFFADGIAEEVLTGLSRFPNLRVLARNSTFQYKGRAVDVRQIGRELDADYVVEGSVRKAANTVRVTVQLLDTSSGAHVWAENYERRLDPDNVFAVQDDITSQVVARVGDIHGAVNLADIQKLRSKSTASLDDYECVLRTYEYQRFLTPDKHAEVKACLTRTVERNPNYADAWANLAYTYVDQYWTDYDGPQDPLERAHKAARKAVELDPSSQRAHFSLANVHFFHKDLNAFFFEAEKALALNPNNTDVVAALGVRFVYAGKRDRGVALMKKAMALNPSHPGWYWFPIVYDHYWNLDYEKSLEAARRIDMPGFFYSHLTLAMNFGQLGQRNRAQTAVSELRRLNPGFEKDPYRYLGMWFTKEHTQNVIDGLRKAGLEIPAENR
jgi:TolB-like protein